MTLLPATLAPQHDGYTSCYDAPNHAHPHRDERSADRYLRVQDDPEQMRQCNQPQQASGEQDRRLHQVSPIPFRSVGRERSGPMPNPPFSPQGLHHEFHRERCQEHPHDSNEDFGAVTAENSNYSLRQ